VWAQAAAGRITVHRPALAELRGVRRPGRVLRFRSLRADPGDFYIPDAEVTTPADRLTAPTHADIVQLDTRARESVVADALT
jgi:hypothetical protein